MARNTTGRAAAAALTALLLLGGCADWQRNPNATGGTLLGAAAGGLIGSQFGSGVGALAATGAGTLIGGALGNQAGSSLDRADAVSQAPPPAASVAPTTGGALAWRNPDGFAAAAGYGTVAPINGSRGDCREFQQTIVIAGQRQNAYGTACRQADGTWKIVP